jgi:single-strand DNA-binding protein|tara:strand:+ start:958 stop:1368 length:411 start_codon:yes stop_codon:yes gene_type:complete
MYNSITVIGNLGRDPEIRETSKGSKYATLSIATNRVIQGERETDWHKVVVWDAKIADVLQRFTKKGSKVLLQGRLTYAQWEKNGQTVKTAEIHLDRFESQMKLLDSKKDSENEPASNEIAGLDELDDTSKEEKAPF